MGGFGSPYMLLSSDVVAKELELVDDQKAKIKAINEKAMAAMREAGQGMRDLSPEERQKRMAEMRDKMQAQRNETNKALQGVLLDHRGGTELPDTPNA
jgi:Spy/CpxP family protein refolding chaperone